MAVSVDVVDAAKALAAVFKKPVVSASRKLRGHQHNSENSSGRRLWCRMPSLCWKKKTDEDGDDLAGEEVWRKEVLMGAKCQPLDFSGVIHHDSEQRQLPKVTKPSRQQPPDSVVELPQLESENLEP